MRHPLHPYPDAHADATGEEANDSLAARLRRAGQRATPQRLVILGALRAGEHLSADEVFARVEPLLPAVNRSTVYRTLELFRDLGLVSETDLGAGVRQFELLDGRHHHLVCRVCGGRTELDDALVAPLREAIRARHGFTAGIDHLALFGRCATCADADADADNAGPGSGGAA
ncbi:MAG TPA: Fur family transcriptional regulator [Thermomicrobiales bacterium]|nr:Fur family transcriptional regulator [Thermomicrobiales bacterium]